MTEISDVLYSTLKGILVEGWEKGFSLLMNF